MVHLKNYTKDQYKKVMKMNHNKFNLACNSIAVLFTAIQADQTLQLISFILTIISIIVSLSFTLWKWVKEIKKDDNITPDEIMEGADIVNEHLDKIKDAVSDFDSKNKNTIDDEKKNQSIEEISKESEVNKDD